MTVMLISMWVSYAIFTQINYARALNKVVKSHEQVVDQCLELGEVIKQLREENENLRNMIKLQEAP